MKVGIQNLFLKRWSPATDQSDKALSLEIQNLSLERHSPATDQSDKALS